MESEKGTGSQGPITIDVVDRDRKAVGSLDLDPAVFAAPVKTHLLHEVVVYQEAKARAGTAATKTRGMVEGSSRKPFRQKGTGRARQGSRKSPLLQGGGTIFGPSPRDYTSKVPKKVKKAALKAALSAKRGEEKLLIVDEVPLGEIKTREMAEWMEDLGTGMNALIVVPERDEKAELSARNLKKVKVIRAEGLNVRDILLHDYLVLTKGAVEKIQETLS